MHSLISYKSKRWSKGAALLRCVALCCVVLRCAALCCVVLRCAALCCVGFVWYMRVLWILAHACVRLRGCACVAFECCAWCSWYSWRTLWMCDALACMKGYSPTSLDMNWPSLPALPSLDLLALRDAARETSNLSSSTSNIQMEFGRPFINHSYGTFTQLLSSSIASTSLPLWPLLVLFFESNSKFQTEEDHLTTTPFIHSLIEVSGEVVRRNTIHHGGASYVCVCQAPIRQVGTPQYLQHRHSWEYPNPYNNNITILHLTLCTCKEYTVGCWGYISRGTRAVLWGQATEQWKDLCWLQHKYVLSLPMSLSHSLVHLSTISS